MNVGDIAQVPEWIGTAMLGAVIAAVGYVAKLIMEWSTLFLNRRRDRRARLIGLHSLLKATNAAFRVQCENRNRLMESIAVSNPEIYGSEIENGFEKLFVAAFPNMVASEKELHSIIRSVTEHTLYPLNMEMLEWLKKDIDFKTASNKTSSAGILALKLENLEVHLLLWKAKYQVWIPGNTNHALVYLGDEERHGVAFPHGIESDVEQVLGK